MGALGRIILVLLLLIFLSDVAYAYGAPPCGGNKNCHVGGESIKVKIVAPLTIEANREFEVKVQTDVSSKEELGMRIYFPAGFQCLSGKTESAPSFVASYYETPSDIHTPYSFKLRAPSDYSGYCTISVWVAGTNKETGMFNRTGYETTTIYSKCGVLESFRDHPITYLISFMATILGTLFVWRASR